MAEVLTTKKVRMILAFMICFAVTAAFVPTDTYAASKLVKPKIKTLKSTAGGSFTVTSKKYSKVTGFQIKYSLKKSFSKSKTIKYKGKKLKKKVTGLKGGKTYYVRIRTYKATTSGKKYSKWSSWKSVVVRTKVAPKTVYTSVLNTTLYQKDSSSSASIVAWYNSKMTLLETRASSTGTWNKVKFNGKYYYVWIPKGSSKFVSTPKVKAPYTQYCTTDRQREVVALAFDFLDNKNTAYDFTQQYSDGVMRSGKYTFHCSGFASYVINTVMQKYEPEYYLSSDLESMSTSGEVLNPGANASRITSTLICKGSIDLSKMKPGDLVFFKEMENDPRAIDHVGIYIGNGQMIQSSRVLKKKYTNRGYDADGGVNVAPLREMYGDGKDGGFIKVIRVLPN